MGSSLTTRWVVCSAAVHVGAVHGADCRVVRLVRWFVQHSDEVVGEGMDGFDEDDLGGGDSGGSGGDDDDGLDEFSGSDGASVTRSPAVLCVLPCSFALGLPLTCVLVCARRLWRRHCAGRRPPRPSCLHGLIIDLPISSSSSRLLRLCCAVQLTS